MNLNNQAFKLNQKVKIKNIRPVAPYWHGLVGEIVSFTPFPYVTVAVTKENKTTELACLRTEIEAVENS